MHLGGWTRLWIVVTVLWGFLVVAFALSSAEALDFSYGIDFELVLLALAWWVGPPLVLCALGWSLRWVAKGFRRQAK